MQGLFSLCFTGKRRCSFPFIVSCKNPGYLSSPCPFLQGLYGIPLQQLFVLLGIYFFTEIPTYACSECSHADRTNILRVQLPASSKSLLGPKQCKPNLTRPHVKRYGPCYIRIPDIRQNDQVLDPGAGRRSVLRTRVDREPGEYRNHSTRAQTAWSGLATS
jgi:hypothetical protein